MAFEAVILDIDGTLIDSNHGHARAWVDTLAEHGFDVPVERVQRLIGMGGDKLLPEVTGLSKESPEGKAISKRRAEIFKTRYLPQIKPLPGTRDLLKQLRDTGHRLVVATSAQENEVDELLRTAGADDLIGPRTTSSDADKSKPDPDIVQAALRQLGAAPASSIMIGDTPYDVEAATRAGVPIIAFRSGGWEDHELHGALAVYDDPADLLAHFDESPLRNGNA